MYKAIVLIIFLIIPFHATIPDIQTLSLDQKIGQLFAIPVPLSSPQSKLNKICETINQYHIGCTVLDRMGTIKQQTTIVNHLKKNCVMTPIIAQDLENGLCMRLYDGVRFPKAITCGAIQDNNLIYQMAQEIGRECKLLGVNINLAPIVDIVSNDKSVMKERSYGQDRDNVCQKATAFVHGLLSQGIYPCLKHFPGLGGTASDTHLALPVVPHDKKTLGERELYPFAQLAQITPCIMSAHVQVPAYDNRNYYGATLSQPIITQLLKKQLNFNGLIITDALRMEALTHYFGTATLAIESFNAGHDILLFPASIQEAVQAIKKAIQDGQITESALDERVTKILQAKKNLGVSNKILVSNSVYEQIHTTQAYQLKKQLYQAAVTLLGNTPQQIPVKQTSAIAYVQIGGQFNSTLATELQKYFSELNSVMLESNPRGCDINELLDLTEDTDTVIVALFTLNSDPQLNFGITPNARIIIERLANTKKIILVMCGSPYALKLFEHIPTIVVAYEDDPDAQEAAAKVITGSLIPSGRLPVTISDRFKLGASA